MKIIYWNDHEISYIIEKGFLYGIVSKESNISCLQEIKSIEMQDIENCSYYNYNNCKLTNMYEFAIYTKVGLFFEGFIPEKHECYEEILTNHVDAFRKFNQEKDNFLRRQKRKSYMKENKGYGFDYLFVSNAFEN